MGYLEIPPGISGLNSLLRRIKEDYRFSRANFKGKINIGGHLSKKSRKIKSIPKDKTSPFVRGIIDLANNKILLCVCLLLLLVCVICYHTVLSDDNDIWYHLKYGQLFFENRTWNIDQTQFSWTTFDPSWKYVNW
ncbi:MAG: hypothetical protein PHN49_12645, partial [Candidatus Omnitrophica bacterium]|nr:hypothetical protein [Candidatus Omnitrophota bacterium]